MEIIPWREEFSVNIMLIGMQHKELVMMINNLYDAMKEKKGQEVLCKLVDRMVEYARVHFDNEEKAMLKYEYIGYPSHKIEHDKFVAKTMELQKRLNEKTLVLSLEVISFLKEWLSSHILVTDKKYVPHLTSKGMH